MRPFTWCAPQGTALRCQLQKCRAATDELSDVLLCTCACTALNTRTPNFKGNFWNQRNEGVRKNHHVSGMQ